MHRLMMTTGFKSLGDGSMGSSQFVPTSLFQPYPAVTATQPMGYDRLIEMYENYIVLGAKVNVIITPKVTPVTTQASVNIIQFSKSRTNLPPEDDAEVGENPGSKTVLTQHLSPQKYRLSTTFSSKSDMAFSKMDDRKWGTATSSPIANFYWYLTIVNTGGVQSIDYVAMWSVRFMAKWASREAIALS